MLARLYDKIRDTQMTRDEKIAWLTGIITAGFSGIVLFYYFRWALTGKAFTEHQLPAAGFGDFFASIDLWVRQKFVAVGLGLSYFPGMYLFVAMMAPVYLRYPQHGAVAIYLLSFILFFAAYTWRQVRAADQFETVRRVFICTFMTYPVIFTFNSGNFEILVFMCLALFALLYHSGKTALSTVPLAAAISMKLFPAVFVVLFLADKKYREFLYVGLGVAVFTLYPLLVFTGGILYGVSGYLDRLHASQQMYVNLMIISTAGNHFGHSFLNGLRTVMGLRFSMMQNIMHLWAGIALVVFVAVAAYVIFIETEFWKKFALLLICMCLLPYTSTDYKLMHFFIPLYLFINKPKNTAQPDKFDELYISIFGLLLILKSYVWLHNIPEDNLNVILNPLLMMLMMAVIMATGFEKWRQREAHTGATPNQKIKDIS